MNIAITAVGGGVGQNIIKSLENSNYNVVALDADHLATGLYMTKTAYLIPFANQDSYIPKLLEICRNENISLLFPGSDPELMPLSLNRHLFDEIGTKVVVSRPEVIRITQDINLAFEYLKRYGLNVPHSYLAENFKPKKEDYPFILRQRVGGDRTMNKYLIGNNVEWQTAKRKIEHKISNYLVTEFIEGDEYTCGGIYINESITGVIVMQRILRGGETYKCFTVKNDIVEKEVIRILETLKPFGACNVEFILKNGKPYIFEINARCSGTTAARAYSGFNEPKMIADYLLRGIIPEYTFKEQTILRYWKELSVNNELIDNLRQNQVIKDNLDKK